jgi:hypothetical protein
MSPRDPFAFLDFETPQRKTLILLLAILRKSGGEITLSLDDLTAIDDGASFHKYPSDTGTSLVLRFARKGAEAYFLTATEDQSSKPTISRVSTRSVADPQSQTPSRHAVHDDIDLAMREEEMAQRAQTAQADRLRQARAEAGAMPWRTRPS